MGRSAALGTVLALIGLEILLVGKFDPQESPVGAAIGIVAAAVTIAAQRFAGLRYELRLAWLRAFPQTIWNVVRDTGLLAVALARRLTTGALPHDRFEEMPCDAGGDDACSAAGRAWTLVGVNLSPNTVVLGIDRDAGAVRVHRLV